MHENIRLCVKSKLNLFDLFVCAEKLDCLNISELCLRTEQRLVSHSAALTDP